MIKSETNYLEFIYSFTNFISEYFSTYTYRNSSEQEKLLAEEQIIHSLLLTEKLHMYLVFRNSSYKKYISIFDNLHPFYSFQSHTTYQALKSLQGLIHEYHFQIEDNQILCQSIISQIMSYYPQDSINFIIMTPPSPPWQPDRYDHQQD